MAGVFDLINAGLAHSRKIEAGIFVAKPLSPSLDLALKHFLGIALWSYAENARSLRRLEQRIEFDDRDLVALGRITDLVVADDRRTRPAGNHVWMNVPDDDVAKFSRWDQRAKNEPPILRQVASIEQFDRATIRGDTYARHRIFRRQDEPRALCERQRFDSSVRQFLHRAVGMARKDARSVFERVGLSKIETGKKFQIEARLSSERSRQRLIKLDRNSESPRLGANVYPVIQILVGIGANGGNFILRRSSLPRLEIGNRIPLRRSRREAQVSSGGDTLIVQNDLHAVHLLIAEDVVIGVVKQQNAQAVALENVLLGQMQFGSRGREGSCSQQDQKTSL